jgi:hypothetical protein
MILAMRIVLFILVFVSINLGYGYWHAKTHGSLNISIYDASDEKTFTLLKDVHLVLRDEAGKVLATGQSDSRYGTVYLSHPVTGSCYEAEHNATRSNEGRNAWQICFRKHSTWLMEWVYLVRFVDVHVGDCMLENIPVLIKEYDADWWMWWVPLPHVGGKPYAYFSLNMRIDPVVCSVLN